MKISDYNKSSVENWLTAHNLPHLIQTSILKQKIKCGKSYCKLERLVSDWKSRAYAIQRLQGKKEFTTCNDHFFLGTPPRKGSSRKQQPIAAESNVNIARETMLLGGNHILACDEIHQACPTHLYRSVFLLHLYLFFIFDNSSQFRNIFQIRDFQFINTAPWCFLQP